MLWQPLLLCCSYNFPFTPPFMFSVVSCYLGGFAPSSPRCAHLSHLFLSPHYSLYSKLCQISNPHWSACLTVACLLSLCPPLHSAVLFMQGSSPATERLIMKKWRDTECGDKESLQFSEKRQKLEICSSHLLWPHFPLLHVGWKTGNILYSHRLQMTESMSLPIKANFLSDL